MPDNRVDIHYTVHEVTSAQRMRMIKSKQFVFLIIIWGGGVLFILLHVLLPQVFNIIPGVTWPLVYQAAGLYLVTFLSLLYIIPWVSFQFTRFWRLSLVFYFNTKSIRLAVAGKSGGLRLNWEDVHRVEEYRTAFIIYYEGGSKHFIVPKSAFTNPKSERRFRDLLDKIIHPSPGAAAESKPAAGSTQEDAEPEEEKDSEE